MTAGHGDRRPVKIRRRGRHATPSQVEKVAQQAGKAAPAFAIAGVLVAAPQAPHLFAAPAKTVPTTPGQTTGQADAARQAPAATRASLDSYIAHTVTVATTAKARHTATTTTSREYTVRSGDTLSSIAQRYYGKAGDWQWLFHENDKTVSDPNLIYPGQKLDVPSTAPANYTLPDYSSYVPKHAAAAPASDTNSSTGSSNTGATVTAQPTTQSGGGDSSSSGGSSSSSTVTTTASVQGNYSCSDLEQLWDSAGGNSADAFMAAEIAMAESSGDPNAISPTDDFGLWQINASNGSLATLNPYENARSAIILSDDGTNWNAWTTYTSGRYYGQC
jgi:LysM repeat protein